MTQKYNPFEQKPASIAEQYKLLKRYYDNNELYNDITYYANQNAKWVEKMKPLYNPAHRSISFFENKLLQGKSIGVSTKNQKAKDAILQFHKWSNLDSIKSKLSQGLALYGDLYLKIVVSQNKVYLESIEPEYISSCETDKRGYIQSIKIDVPQVDENNRNYWFTEYWNKADGYFVVYKNYLGPNAKLEDLDISDSIQMGTLQQLGIDFIPIVYCSFSNTDERGQNAFVHALRKIDECNRQATKLHQTFFRNGQASWALTHTSTNGQGTPVISNTLPEDVTLELEENSLIDLPSNTSITSLTPNLPYADGLAIINNLLLELERELPELKYFNLSNGLSGDAIRGYLTAASDRVLSAQSSLLAALVRADEVALTLGERFGLFSGIGNYQNGDFNHDLIVDDLMPYSFTEKINILQGLNTAGIGLASALKMLKFSEDEIESIVADSANSQTNNVNSFITAFNK